MVAICTISTHPLWIEVTSSIVAIEADVTDSVDMETVQPAFESTDFPMDPHVANPLQGNLPAAWDLQKVIHKRVLSWLRT